MTALYFVIFGVLTGERIRRIGGFEYMQYIAPGLIVMPIIANSNSRTALSLYTAKFHKLLDEHLVSPLPSWMIVASYVAGGLTLGILVGAAVDVVALLFMQTHVQHFFLMIGALLLISLVASLAGFINAMSAKTFDQVIGILSFVLTPLTYCGGVFYWLCQRFVLRQVSLYGPIRDIRWFGLTAVKRPLAKSPSNPDNPHDLGSNERTAPVSAAAKNY